jgi:hypothetical protein
MCWNERLLLEKAAEIQVKAIGIYRGRDRSVAKKMSLFIEKDSGKFPLRKSYFLIGPNSNSFIQWVIDKFPDSGFKLPFNAFGKGYKVER